MCFPKFFFSTGKSSFISPTLPCGSTLKEKNMGALKKVLPFRVKCHFDHECFSIEKILHSQGAFILEKSAILHDIFSDRLIEIGFILTYLLDLQKLTPLKLEKAQKIKRNFTFCQLLGQTFSNCHPLRIGGDFRIGEACPHHLYHTLNNWQIFHSIADQNIQGFQQTN